jgi:hypothetical protein
MREPHLILIASVILMEIKSVVLIRQNGAFVFSGDSVSRSRSKAAS